MSAQETPRSKLIGQLKLLLGDQMTDVELDIEHYNTAVDIAIDRLRQRSSGSTEESSLFVTLQPEVQEYKLPDEVQDVRKLYRRGVGANSTGGTNFDPFEAAFSNIYLLQAGRTGGLATWDFFAQYQETIGRVFGSEINFTWEYTTRTLTLIRKITAEEDVLIHVYNQKPEIALLEDVYTRPWLRDYSLAMCKFMLGEARGKFTSGLPGPGGSVTFNGEQLKAEAQAEMERLEQEIQNFNTGSHGMPFIIA
jgi:hypothetical protein